MRVLHDADRRPARPTIPLSRRVLYSLFVLGVVFGVPELFLRAVWVPPIPSADAVGTRRFITWLSELSLGRGHALELCRDDPELLWSLRPGTRFESSNYHRAVDGELQAIHITINDGGYRGDLVPARKTDPRMMRVLCVGDSNFFGYPLDDADAFPLVLERAMNRQAPAANRAAVINGGVPGYSALQGRRWYERKFQDHEYDWLLLSYLNNDAWLQPHSDREQFRRRTSLSGRCSRAGSHVYLVRWARSVTRQDTSAEQDRVPRVPLSEFLDAYRFFIATARTRRADVLILDYRAYREYEPYSVALRRLAATEGVRYIPVAEVLSAAFANGMLAGSNEERAGRVLRRWGPKLLAERPYLWYYAEYRPEHLNEVGTARLADVVAPLLLARASP